MIRRPPRPTLFPSTPLSRSPAARRARAVGGPAGPAAVVLGTGGGGSPGWGGVVVGAAQRAGVALARTSLDGRGHLRLGAYLRRRPQRAGVVTQAAAQAIVQGETARPVLRLDVRRGAEPFRRMRQRHGAAGEPLE